jgi:holo-ACP synthase CitX
MKENVIKFTEEEIKLIKTIYETCIEQKINMDEINKIYKDEYLPEDILIAREERVYRQENLIAEYKNSLLTIRVNYPGVNKNNYISFSVIKALGSLVIKKFNDKVLHKEFNITAEGPIVMMIIKEDHNKVKLEAVDIEESHVLGRCVDIDVYDKRGKGLSRGDLGVVKRKCYLCNDFAQNCVRSRKHDIGEIEKFIKDKLDEYVIQKQ